MPCARRRSRSSARPRRWRARGPAGRGPRASQATSATRAAGGSRRGSTGRACSAAAQREHREHVVAARRGRSAATRRRTARPCRRSAGASAAEPRRAHACWPGGVNSGVAGRRTATRPGGMEEQAVLVMRRDAAATWARAGQQRGRPIAPSAAIDASGAAPAGRVASTAHCLATTATTSSRGHVIRPPARRAPRRPRARSPAGPPGGRRAASRRRAPAGAGDHEDASPVPRARTAPAIATPSPARSSPGTAVRR